MLLCFKSGGEESCKQNASVLSSLFADTCVVLGFSDFSWNVQTWS